LIDYKNNEPRDRGQRGGKFHAVIRIR